MTKAQVAALRVAAGVRSIEENGTVTADNVPGNADFGVTKARADMPSLDGNADGAPATYSAGDLVAAVIDTGIDATHNDLNGGKVLAFVDCTHPSGAPVCTSTTPYDDHGHGTHVAATIAGTGAGSGQPGVAPGAGLVGIKVLDSNGSGTDAMVIAGVQWAVAHKADYGIRVINLSLGDSGNSDGTDALSAAVNAAVAAGIVAAVAAGNDGPALHTVAAPGAAADALTVGALVDTASNGFAQAYFSSRGPTLDNRVKPDISAPGWNIVSAAACTTGSGCDHNATSTKSGTSMATPFVAGVVLLMLAAHPSLTPAQVKSLIMATAVDWGPVGTDNEYGAGRLDGYAALAAAGAALTAPPTPPAHATWTVSVTDVGSGGTGSVDLPLAVAAGGASLALSANYTTAAGSPAGYAQLITPGSVVSSGSFLGRDSFTLVGGAAAGTWTLRPRSTSGALAYVLDVSGSIDAPSISGTAADGQTLTAATGTWSGASSGFAYAWQRCDAVGSRCSAITGASASTYSAAPADIGSTLRVLVTVPVGTATARSLSAATAAVGTTPPVNTVLPGVTGTAGDGQVLTASSGTWTGSTSTFAYQWQRCSAGPVCASVASATASTYTLVSADIGSFMRVRVTATNAASAVQAFSAVTAAVASATPAATVLPSISGTAQDGQTLSGGLGTWTGSLPMTFVKHWERCDAAGVTCVAIGGATSLTYAVGPGDIGSRLRFSVGATNVVNTPGQLTALSSLSAVVVAVPPPPPVVVAVDAGGGGGGGGGGGVNPDLQTTISVERPTIVNVGDTVRYIISTTNLGPGGAQLIYLAVALPAEVELVGTEVDRGSGCTGTTQLSCFLDFLTPPQVAIVKVTVRVRGGSQLVLAATSTGLQPDNNVADNTATVTITIGAPVAAPTPAVTLPVPRSTEVRETTQAPSAASVSASAIAAVKVAAVKAAAAQVTAEKAAAERVAAARVAAARLAAAKTPAARAVAQKELVVKQAAARAATAKVVVLTVIAKKAAAAAVPRARP